jgi:hypothetical protein
MAKTTDLRTSSNSENTMQIQTGQGTVNTYHLQKMIAESAYYRAEHRGFTNGNPEEDWLMAEREITSKIHSRQTN